MIWLVSAVAEFGGNDRESLIFAWKEQSLYGTDCLCSFILDAEWATVFVRLNTLVARDSIQLTTKAQLITSVVHLVQDYSRRLSAQAQLEDTRYLAGLRGGRGV